MNIIGIDTSLTHTGWCVLNDKGKVLASGVIKSSPVGDRPEDELLRIQKIVATLDFYCDDFNPNYMVIEGLAFSARNSTALVQLSALNYMTRAMATSWGMNFLVVAPTSLKKFITGSGKGDKDQMQMQIYKNYGFEAKDNNEADGYALALVGLAHFGKPLKKLNVAQKEVISLLVKQHGKTTLNQSKNIQGRVEEDKKGTSSTTRRKSKA